MNGWEILLGLLLGLFGNELCDVSPWMARKLVRRAAYLQIPDPEEAAARAEELTAVINDRPGKLFKLLTALGFYGYSITASGRRMAARQLTSARRLEPQSRLRFAWGLSVGTTFLGAAAAGGSLLMYLNGDGWSNGAFFVVFVIAQVAMIWLGWKARRAMKRLSRPNRAAGRAQSSARQA